MAKRRTGAAPTPEAAAPRAVAAVTVRDADGQEERVAVDLLGSLAALERRVAALETQAAEQREAMHQVRAWAERTAQWQTALDRRLARPPWWRRVWRALREEAR